MTPIRIGEWLWEGDYVLVSMTIFKPWRVFRWALAIVWISSRAVNIDIDLWFVAFGFQFGKDYGFFIEDIHQGDEQ